MSTFKFFNGEDLPYNPKLVNKYILIIQRSSEQSKIDEFVLLLYMNMKKVVLKNVNNYLSLINNSNIKKTLEADELKTEAFIVLKNCLTKYKVHKSNNFYFYFNKSLSRNFYRMYEKEVKKNTTRITDISMNYIEGLKNSIEFDITSYIIDNLKFDRVERLVLISKYNQEKKEDFLINNPSINTAAYYNAIKSTKQVLIQLIQDGEL